MENLPLEIEEIINQYKYEMEHLDKFRKTLNIIKNIEVNDYYATGEMTETFKKVSHYPDCVEDWGWLLQHYREIRINGKIITYCDDRPQNQFVKNPKKYRLEYYENQWNNIGRLE